MADPGLPPPPDGPGGLRRVAGRGYLWTLANSLIAKAAALAAQIVLGWLLLADDWGRYALLLVMVDFVAFLRTMGVSQILVQRGAAQYDRLAGPAFWLSLAGGLLGALALLIAVPHVVAFYREPQLGSMLLLVAATLPLGGPTAVLQARLQIDLRFATIARNAVLAALLRQLAVVAAAGLGAGAVSFAWAMLAAALSELALACCSTAARPWRQKPSLRLWTRLLRPSLWVMLGNVAAGFTMRGDYLVLSLLVGLGLLGQYTFAYELTAQIAILLAGNAQAVLFPVLARLAAEPERLREALARAFGVLTLSAAAPAVLLAVLAAPLELLAWHGKWAATVPAMQIFALTIPFRLLSMLAYACLAAQARFALRCGLLALHALAIMASAALGFALFGPSLVGLAGSVAAAELAIVLLWTQVVLVPLGLAPGRLAGMAALGWAAAALAGAAAFAADRWLLQALAPGSRLALGIAVFALILLPLLRAWRRPQLDELVAILPRPAASLARRLLLLPGPA
jgi:PST family polysaccharide transporter